MIIALITPSAPHVRNGNRNTAQRWACFLRKMGHRVIIQVEWDGRHADLMVALHARRSHDSIKHFSKLQPHSPLIVVLTGTDLYRDIQTDKNAQESIRLATRMVVLQEMGLAELSPPLQAKTRVIYQSATPIKPMPPLKNSFEVCIIGNLREEKDPFRCALASALLPEKSRIKILQIGQALNQEYAEEAQELMRHNPRYLWLGEMPHWQVRRKLARCRLLVITSRMEGGANVVCEALAADLPVIASAVSGNIGMLGQDYAGYYPYGDENSLSKLLYRAESEPEFYNLLKTQCAARKTLIQPQQESTGLQRLLEEVICKKEAAPD